MNKGDFLEKFSLKSKFKDRSEIKIKFFVGMNPSPSSGNQLWVNPSIWILKCYYDLNGLFPNRFNWLLPQLNDKGMSADDLMQVIDRESPDVVCFGMFDWNSDRYSRLGKLIREKYPDTVIIIGGPNIAIKNRNDMIFWQDHDYANIAVYGDGEEALTTILDAMVGSDFKGEACNIVFRTENESIDAGYKRFFDERHLGISPYLHCKEMIRNTIEDLKKNHNGILLLNWEFTRGCPYRCSFCDWNSGLHHKVSRKKYDYESDLRFFNELDIWVNWIDANVGLYNEDVSILDKFLEIGRENPNFRVKISNFSKNKKDVVYDLMEKIEAQYPKNDMHQIGIQDIHSEVLSNIDRPDIPWDNHKKLLADFKKRNPGAKFNTQVIIGLPGQTLETFSDMMWEFANNNVASQRAEIFSLLPNSPAAEISYQEKYKLKFRNTGVMNTMPYDSMLLEEIPEKLHLCEWSKANLIYSTYSANFADHIAMAAMSSFYTQHASLCNKNNLQQNSEYLYNILKSKKWQEFGQEQAELIDKNSRLFGFPMILIEKDGRAHSIFQYFANRKNWAPFLK